jgi:hypothetical protein
MSLAKMDTIKVDEIVPGGVIRCFITDENDYYLIVHDFIANWCEISPEEAVELWKSFSQEDKHKLRNYMKQYSGPSETEPVFKEIDTITFPGCLKLATMLVSADSMKKLMIFIKILYFNMRNVVTGLKLNFDESSDDEDKAGSSSKVSPKKAKDPADSKKRPREDDDLEYKQRETTWKNQEFKNIHMFVAAMNNIDRNWNKDPHLAIRTIDWAREVAFGKPKIPLGDIISVHKVAQDLGRKLTTEQAVEIEQNAGVAYNTRYLTYPLTTANGGYMFMERDRDLVAAEITRFFEPA